MQPAAGSSWQSWAAPPPPPLPPDAAAAAAVAAAKQLNCEMGRAATLDELFAAVCRSWQALDIPNLSAALHRLAELRAGAPPRTHQQLAAHPVLAWLLGEGGGWVGRVHALALDCGCSPPPLS